MDIKRTQVFKTFDQEQNLGEKLKKSEYRIFPLYLGPNGLFLGLA